VSVRAAADIPRLLVEQPKTFPWPTMRYDRARTSLDRHAAYIVATYIAGAARYTTLTVTYWCTSDGRIVLLTVFRKTRQHEQRQIDRAVRAQKTCEREHHGPATETYERQV
jgi:hypothetical protein